MATIKKRKASSNTTPVRVIVEVVMKDETRSLRVLRMGFDEEQIELDVKLIILTIAGNRKIKPRDLPNETLLDEQLGYNGELRVFLHVALNNYVDHKRPGASVSEAEIDDCKTAGDCIELVKSKL